MAWALAKCPEFLKSIVFKVSGFSPDPKDITITNQQYDSDTGITDIEITDYKNFHMVIEAKRGWLLPGAEQLTKYSIRSSFVNTTYAYKHIVSMSECTQEYAKSRLPFQMVNGIPVSHLSYREVYRMALNSKARSNNEQKHLLQEFCEYLRWIMTMQKLDSNMVYVVALSAQRPERCSITWIDIVQKHNKYFCPVGGNGWPKEPPNYIAFRYSGQLQSIHHIEGYSVTNNIHDEIQEMPDEVWNVEHYVYRLGPASHPHILYISQTETSRHIRCQLLFVYVYQPEMHRAYEVQTNRYNRQPCFRYLKVSAILSLLHHKTSLLFFQD